MDQNSLRRLASEGIESFPPSALQNLVEWCWDFGEASGDARYSSLSASLALVAGLFEDDGAAPNSLVQALNEHLYLWIPAILQANTAADGALSARSFRQDVAETISRTRW